MTPTRSDALVFFGATGDLAYKKIFPALHAMARRGHLNVPQRPSELDHLELGRLGPSREGSPRRA